MDQSATRRTGMRQGATRAVSPRPLFAGPAPRPHLALVGTGEAAQDRDPAAERRP